ncbi:MAG: GDYXXLXY domain-containing protein [Alphaproteobacteria bacterium]
MSAIAARHFSLDRLAARLPAGLRYALCFLVLGGLLATMIVERAMILRSGTEIRLAIVPVDPRDLFRGDYVVLDYEIGELRLDGIAGDKQFARDDAIWVTLRPGADGRAVAVAAHRAPPPAAAPDVVVRGRVTYFGRQARRATAEECRDRCLAVGVAYGIESYFLPEGEGRTIETTEKSRLEIVAAVSRSGEAAIKRLLLDGRMLFAEPLY